MVDVEVITKIQASPQRIFDIKLDSQTHAASLASTRETSTTSSGQPVLSLGDTVTFRAKHFGLWWTLTSRITELNRATRFVDQQVRGPFAYLRHEHLFEAQPDGSTLMIDRMSFRPPFGLLGRSGERVLSAYLRRLLRQRASYVKTLAEAS